MIRLVAVSPPPDVSSRWRLTEPELHEVSCVEAGELGGRLLRKTESQETALPSFIHVASEIHNALMSLAQVGVVPGTGSHEE